MPNEKDPRDDNYGLPDNWAPVDSKPVVPSAIATLPAYTVEKSFLSGSISPGMQLSPDLIATGYGGPVASHRLMPIPPSGNAQVNAAAQSTVAAINKTVISANILLQTNNVNNPIQNILDLVEGDGIDISVGTKGTVVIASTGSGPILFDDFIFGSPTGTSSVGSLNWQGVGTNTGLGGVGLNNFGLYQIAPANFVASNSLGYMFSFLQGPSGSSIAQGGNQMALSDYAGWTMTWVFQVTRPWVNINPYPSFSMTDVSMYLGASSTDFIAAGVGRPGNFIGLRFDTSTTSPSIADTTFVFECVSNGILNGGRINTQGNTFNTGITPTEFVFYTLVMKCVAPGSISFSLSGSDGSSASDTLTVPLLTVGSTGSAGLFNVSAANGIAIINYDDTIGGPSGTLGGQPFTDGSIVTIANAGVFGGIWTLLFLGSDTANGTVVFAYPTTVSSSTTKPTVTGYPALTFSALMSNDEGISPTKSKALNVDKFIFSPG